MKRSAILIFFFVNSLRFIGQYEIIKTSESELDEFWGISFVNDSTGFVTLTTYSNPELFGSHILKTTDYGDTWDTVYTSLTSTYQEEILIKDVYFINENQGWASGVNTPFILKTIDGGQTWTQIDIVVPGQPNFPVIEFFDENFGVALNGFSGQHAIYTMDGGNNWTIRDSLTGHDVSFIDECNFIVNSGGRIKKLLDCELNFQVFPTSEDGNIPKRSGRLVHVFDENEWLFGALGLIGFNNFPSIIKTYDGGQSFTYLDFPFGSQPICFEFVNDSIGFTSFLYNDLVSCSAMKTFDRGNTWYCQETPLYQNQNGSLENSEFYDIECLSENVCYASNLKCIYRTFNGGGPLGQMWTSISEIKESAVIDFSISPNPATNHITISTNQHFSPSTQIQFFDLSGRLILTEQIQSRSNKITIDVGNLSSGIYTCVVSDKNEKYKPVKWSKE